MARWTYSITLCNNLKRDLVLTNKLIPWGTISSFPERIKPGESGNFTVYSPSGASYGVEFSFQMRDVPEEGKPNHGTVDFYVDIPYWSYQNTNTLKTSGALMQTGFSPISYSGHDWSTTAIISSKLNDEHNLLDENISLSASDCANSYEWDFVEGLKILEDDDVDLEAVIPKQNTTVNTWNVGRSEAKPVGKKYWQDINDPKFDDYCKLNFVDSYFTAVIYKVKKSGQIPIAKNQTYLNELEITHRSTTRRELSTEFMLESAIHADATAFTADLRMSYRVHSLAEYCTENQSTQRISCDYQAMDSDRTIVLWDIDKCIALYRTDMNGVTELVGIGDYYLSSVIKTYLSNDAKIEETAEIEETTEIEQEESLGSDYIKHFRINNVQYECRVISAAARTAVSCKFVRTSSNRPSFMYDVSNVKEIDKFNEFIILLERFLMGSNVGRAFSNWPTSMPRNINISGTYSLKNGRKHN